MKEENEKPVEIGLGRRGRKEEGEQWRGYI
jgi:hypothetical protein